MRALLLIPALAALAACGMQSKRETYTCANGPNLAVTYADDQATIAFPDGRVEVLDATDKPDIYAKPGMVWNSAAFRTARLDDEGKSLLCDQMEG